MTSEPKIDLPALTVALVGLTSLMYELVQVRMLAFFLGNNLDFLAIPIALLGLALGSMYWQFIHRGAAGVLVARLRLAVLPLLLVTFLLFFRVADTWFNKIHVGLADPTVDAIAIGAALYVTAGGIAWMGRS